MVAASRPVIIQLEASFVPAQKDMNCKWTTPHVWVGYKWISQEMILLAI